MVKPFLLVVMVAGLNTLGANAERQAISPRRRVRNDARLLPVDARRGRQGRRPDRLRYVRGRLDNATAPEPVAIREYLAPYRLN